jgi:murein DD-endopeptidase MepM/ murein hydrolase activator NlpD
LELLQNGITGAALALLLVTLLLLPISHGKSSQVQNEGTQQAPVRTWHAFQTARIDAPPKGAEVSRGREWEWPVVGPITNLVEPDHPLGIDIGLAELPDSPIKAVADGRVTFVGGDACCSYGLYIQVEHADGISSLYAHLSRFDVSEGQSVRQGDVLGISGDTGRSTAEHLHFEMQRGDTRLDPLDFFLAPCPYRSPLYALYVPDDQGCRSVPHVGTPDPHPWARHHRAPDLATSSAAPAAN